MWTNRVWAEFRAGNVTRAWRDVLLTLATYRGGWPSHATLASRAGCAVRTVQRALQRARDIGLVSWTERRVKRGWRWLRTSNAYRLDTPAAGVSTTGQAGRGGERLRKKVTLDVFLAAAARVPDLLAMRRKAFGERLPQ